MDVSLPWPALARRLRPDPDAAHHAKVLVGSCAVAAVFLHASLLRAVTSLPHFCLFERLLGIPCPGCGMTGSLASLANGDLASSLALHPVGVGLVLAVAVQSLARAARLLRWAPAGAPERLIRTLNGGILVALLAVWAQRLLSNA
jgi:hypothetical protein